MLVSITDFATERGVDRDTVNAYLRKHPEIKEETRREGKNVVIDTDSKAYEALNKQYPLPAPVEVIEDTESRQQLIQAQQLIIQLQQQIVDMQQEQVHKAEIEAKATAMQAILEQKENTIERLDSELQQTREAYKDLQQKYSDECSMTWLDKLLNRKKRK